MYLKFRAVLRTSGHDIRSSTELIVRSIPLHLGIKAKFCAVSQLLTIPYFVWMIVFTGVLVVRFHLPKK